MLVLLGKLTFCKRFQLPPYKLHVMLPQEEFDSHAAVPDSFRGEEHAGVYCVCCHRGVIGFRYKCLVCPDYDICARYVRVGGQKNLMDGPLCMNFL